MSELTPDQMDKLVVAVDVDGVLACYEKFVSIKVIGDPIPGAREFLVELRKKYKVLIYTTRTSEHMNPGFSWTALRDFLSAWLTLHDMPYDDIWIGQGKPIAQAYIDDRAVACRPQEEPDAFAKALDYLTTLKTGSSADAKST